MRLLPLLCCTLLAGGCNLLPSDNVDVGRTLADLKPVKVTGDPTTIPRLSLEELASVYREVLVHQRDPETVLQIQHRLADIELLSGEDALVGAIEQARLFDPAIAAYEALLRDNPDYERRDNVLYQLSKAYDLRGDAEQSARLLDQLRSASPESRYIAEADFRLAERFFANADYTAAEATYRQVIDGGDQTAFYTRSLYMLGWSRFKLGRYTDAVAAFRSSLDELIPVPASETEAGLSMSRAQRELVDDCLRVMALSFDNLGGVNAIARTSAGTPVRHYQHQLYRALGGLYQEKERFADSAAVYSDFMERYPDSSFAHEFALLAIEAHESGDFPDRILAAKREYVNRFGVQASYWRISDAKVRENINDRLQVYLKQLASHFHSQGQSAEAADEAQEQLLLAVDYYQQFIDSFPQNPAVPGTMFLMAESLYEAGSLPQAIEAYAAMAYTYADDPQAPDAAYMTVQLHQAMSTEDSGQPKATDTTAAAIDAGLRFANTFPEDPRALTVLGDAAGKLLEAQQYQRAVDVATQLLASPSMADASLVDPVLALSASLALGHGQFALGEFALAEAAYSKSLAQMSAEDARRGDTQQRIAASLYRQAEEHRTEGDTLDAAQLFSRATAAAPGSDIGVTALHDAAVSYREGGELQRSIALFEQLRNEHPNHPLSAEVGATLLGIFEELEQWPDAAAELDRLARTLQEPEAQRQSLLLAAQYYDKANAAELSIDRYRQYARNWEQPVEPRLEAMNRLGELYSESGTLEKRDFWLRKIERAHQDAASNTNARMDYLAASACDVLAGSLFDSYRSARLTLPLKQSLKRKRSSMNNALAAYTRCSDYGVESVTTESGYRIGQIYQQFGESLMQSERPGSLDALALEQYELMLEEQAFPFEEKAIAVHETNIERCREQGIYDEWVKASFDALEALVPAQYRKPELTELAEALTPDSQSRRTRKRLQSLNESAIALRKEGNFDGARENYRRALSVEDDDPLTHRNIGILYELYLGQPGRALEHYQRYETLTGGTDRAVSGWIAQLKRRALSVAGEV